MSITVRVAGGSGDVVELDVAIEATPHHYRVCVGDGGIPYHSSAHWETALPSGILRPPAYFADALAAHYGSAVRDAVARWIAANPWR